MSNHCPTCGATLERVRRSLIGRLLFRKVQACGACGCRIREWRVPFEDALTFLFSRHTRCIECGSARVRCLATRDRIDRMSNHPFSVLCALGFAPIYHCSPCRLQYHDWRRADPAASANRAAPTSAS